MGSGHAWGRRRGRCRHPSRLVHAWRTLVSASRPDRVWAPDWGAAGSRELQAPM